MNEMMYYDKEEEDVVDYETASERVYDSITWDDLSKYFLEGFKSGRYCLEEFWRHLPEWMQIDIDDDAFNYLWEYRFEEREVEENA